MQFFDYIKMEHIKVYAASYLDSRSLETDACVNRMAELSVYDSPPIDRPGTVDVIGPADDNRDVALMQRLEALRMYVPM